MKRTFLLFSTLLIFIFSTKAETINLLFLGNSFTGAYGGVPNIVKSMINAGSSGKTVNLSDGVISWGQNFDYIWNTSTESRTKLQSNNYNYVILQGYIANGSVDAAVTANTYGKLLAAEAKDHGAIPIIFSHQADCSAPLSTLSFITSSYKTLATEANAVFGPAALSWLQAQTMIPGLITHNEDCHHQNDIGNYLNACIFYYLITGQTPVGNTYRTSNATTIDASTALLLQQAAAIVVECQSGIAPSAVSIASSLTVARNATSQLTATVTPSNTTNNSVVWTSNNTGVATVSTTGVVTGVSDGTATITATTVDGFITSNCVVTVLGYNPPPSNGTSFRYLKYEIGSSGGEVYLYELEWMVGASAYPTTKATSGSNANISATFPGPGWNPYWMAYDGLKTTSNMWAPPVTYPSPITIDLGAGNAINPTGINVTVDKYHFPTSFKCLGSNDSTNWYLLLEKTGLVEADWGAVVATPFAFPAQITDVQAPSTPSALVSSNISESSFTLSWTGSTDNVGGVGGLTYEVFRNGTSIGTTTTTTMAITGLSASTTYAMTVKSKDAAIPPNVSEASSSLDVTTWVAGTTFKDGDFITLGPLGGVFTSGLNNQEFFHTQMGGDYATKVTSEGNPANAISVGANGCQILLALDAPAEAQTWNISFDQKITGTLTSGPNFNVYGLTTGQALAYADGGGSAGTNLFNQNGIGTETSWTRKSYSVNVPSGYNDIVIEWFANTTGMLMDNITVIASSGTPTQTDYVLDKTTAFDVFPNPASNFITIKADCNIERVEIFTFTGQKVMENHTNAQSISLNTSDFERGMYLVEVKTSEGQYINKIIIK